MELRDTDPSKDHISVNRHTILALDEIGRQMQVKLGFKLSRHDVIRYLINFFKEDCNDEKGSGKIT